jgi:hypothetical protein
LLQVSGELFILWLVGLVNRARIRNFKRTQDFSIEDFRILRALLDWFGPPVVTTPHVLSQVSYLTDLTGAEGMAVRRLLKSSVPEVVEETYDAARQLVAHPLFERFGLATLR